VAVADLDPPLALPTVPGWARGVAADGARDGDGDGDGRFPAAVSALLDRSPGPNAAARARALDKSADDYGDQQRPANTAKSYKADWRRWEDYTAWAGIPMLSGGRGALVGFVVWLEHGGPAPGSMGHWPGYAPATISRRVTGVVYELSHRWRVPIDPRASAAVVSALRGYRRRLAAADQRLGRGQAHPVTVPDLLAISRACPDTLEGLRDRAALTVGFYLAARASDLAWLKVGDIVVERKGLVITVREGKTTGQSALQARQHPLLCPRQNWLCWREAADLQDGPALRRVRGDKVLAQTGEILDPRVGDADLSPDAIIRLLRRASERAGLPYRVTGHGLRRGFVTAAYDGGRGWDPLQIARHGRWADQSAELWGYIHEENRWHRPSGGLDIDPTEDELAHR
jgi:integrase